MNSFERLPNVRELTFVIQRLGEHEWYNAVSDDERRIILGGPTISDVYVQVPEALGEFYALEGIEVGDLEVVADTGAVEQDDVQETFSVTFTASRCPDTKTPH